MLIAASANLDDVRRAFYTQYVPQNTDARWWWVRAALMDPNELVVEDDESGQLYKLAFRSDDQGKVVFGDTALPVKVDFIPDNRDAQKAAASHIAATLEVGRKVAASWTTREDSVLPVKASGGAMDPKEIRTRLGLPEDASDEQVQEKLLGSHPALQGENPATLPPGVAPHDPTSTGGARPVSTGMAEPSENNAQPNPQPVLDPTAASAAGARLPEGFVAIDTQTLESLRVGASAGLEERTARLARERSELVMAAIGDGRIAPASKDHWLKTLETADQVGDPGMRQTLASLPAGLVPVDPSHPRASGANPEVAASQIDDETVHGWTSQLFPELERRSRREKFAVAAGANPNSRVQADASYRR